MQFGISGTYLSIPSGLSSGDFFSSLSGNDGNPGTIDSPFRTLTKGVSVLNPGQSLHVRGGSYNETLINNIPSGTGWGTTQKVRLINYNNEEVTIAPTSGASTRVIEFSGNQQYIEFDGVWLDGAGLRNFDVVKINSGQGSDHAHHIRLQNMFIGGETISDSSSVCQIILCVNADGTSLGGNEFINCVIEDHGPNDFSHSFYIQSPNTLISGCNISGFSGAAVQLYNGFGQNFNNSIVRNNIIHDGRATGSGERHYGIIAANGSTNALIYNNVIYRVPIEGSGSYGIYVFAGSNSNIWNNTIHTNEGYGVLIDAGITGTKFQNNICYNNGQDYVNGSSVVYSNNLVGINPLFTDSSVDNYRIRAGSPCIGAGLVIAQVPTDADRITRTSPYDIGAYKYIP